MTYMLFSCVHLHLNDSRLGGWLRLRFNLPSSVQPFLTASRAYAMRTTALSCNNRLYMNTFYKSLSYFSHWNMSLTNTMIIQYAFVTQLVIIDLFCFFLQTNCNMLENADKHCVWKQDSFGTCNDDIMRMSVFVHDLGIGFKLKQTQFP